MNRPGFIVKRNRDGALLRLLFSPNSSGMCWEWVDLPSHGVTFFRDQDELRAVPRSVLRFSSVVPATEERRVWTNSSSGVSQAAVEDQIALEEGHWS